MASDQRVLPPLSDAIVTSVSRLFEDHERSRSPTHSDLTYLFERGGLSHADPPKPAGKERRVRAVLGWALENNEPAGRQLVRALIEALRGSGGFRAESENYVGNDVIENARAAFRPEGFDLWPDGQLLPIAFEGLRGREATDALRRYAERAARGAEDDPLVVGTSKDLLEATALHVLRERRGIDDAHQPFPSLLGLAFTELGLAAQGEARPDERAACRVERALYEAGCAINALRNREGTGHGRPWLPDVTPAEARLAIRVMGSISAFLLDRLGEAR